MHLAVVVDNFSRAVDDDACIPRHAKFVAFHNAEAAPDLVLYTRRLEPRHFWAVQITHDRVICRHAQSMYAIFWKHDHVHERVALSRFLDQAANVIDCMFELVSVQDVEEL